MSKLNFQSVIKIYNGNPYILVTKKQANTLTPSWKKPLPILVQINGQPKPPWKINMMPIGDGDFYLYLHGDVRKASKTKVGDKVLVGLSFDTDYKPGPAHSMPDWFKEKLDSNKTAKENWDKLIPSRQKEILRYFSWLKSDDAKERNINKAMQALTGEETRFMARTWKNGK